MTEKITFKQICAIIGAGLFSFSGVLIETATNITFPTLMSEFNISTSTVQWMTTGNLLMLGIFIPISPYLKRRFKTKNLFLTAAMIFVFGVVLDIIATSYIVLILGRIVQGIGVGIALPMMYNIILEESPSSMIGSMMGIGAFVTAAAPALGPTFGGLMIEYFSWRAIFIGVIPMTLIAIGLGGYGICNNSADCNAHLDCLGFGLIIITFVSMIFGLSNLDKIIEQPEVILYFICGLLSLGAFIYHERHTRIPLIDMKIFKQKRFTYHTLVIMFFQMITLGFGLILPTFVQIVFEKPAVDAGVILLPGAIIGALGAPIGGILLDKFNAKRPVLIGTVIATIAVIGFAIGFSIINYSLCLGLYALYMLGIGMIIGNTITCALSALKQNYQADGNAALQTLQQLSGAIGTSVSAAILAFVQQQESLSTATKWGSYYVIVLLSGLSVLALLIQFRALKGRK